MAFLTGLLVVDAPASALNNAGSEGRAPTDNVIFVKKIRTPQGVYPYVSAQAVRFWIRSTLERTRPGVWKPSPVFREGKIAYTSADPIEFWDDDLFGYMRAPSKRSDALKDAKASPLEKDREITRISPLRVGTMVAVAPSPIVDDFGAMTRQDDDPVLHKHEFYRAHLATPFSLDLTCAGTFFDAERVGYKSLDSFRRDKAKKMNLDRTPVRGQAAYRLPLALRQERVAVLVHALGELEGGAKLALHYTDVAPAIVVAAVTRSGNHPFIRLFKATREHGTELDIEALAEVLRVFRADFRSKIYIGWAKGFLDDERAKLPSEDLLRPVGHPREAVAALAVELREARNADWYDD